MFQGASFGPLCVVLANMKRRRWTASTVAATRQQPRNNIAIVQFLLLLRIGSTFATLSCFHCSVFDHRADQACPTLVDSVHDWKENESNYYYVGKKNAISCAVGIDAYNVIYIQVSSIYVLSYAQPAARQQLREENFLSLYVALTTSLAANFSIGGGGQHLPNRFSARIRERMATNSTLMTLACLG